MLNFRYHNSLDGWKYKCEYQPYVGVLKTLLVKGMVKYTHIRGSSNFEFTVDKYLKLYRVIDLDDLFSQIKKIKFKYANEALVTS